MFLTDRGLLGNGAVTVQLALASFSRVREVDCFLEAAEAAVQAHLDEPARAISAAFGTFLAAAADDPLVRGIVSGERRRAAAPRDDRGHPVLVHATERLAAFLGEGWPTMAPEQAPLLAECVVRLAISHAALPSGPAGAAADAVATLLGPYLEGVLA